jgi:VanZ family protein
MTTPNLNSASSIQLRLLFLGIVVVLIGTIWMSLEPRSKDTWYVWEQWNHLTHALAYATLMTAAGLLLRDLRSVGYAAGFLIILSTGLELAQWYIPGRTADLEDAGANLIGISGGFTLSVLWFQVRDRWHASRTTQHSKDTQ